MKPAYFRLLSGVVIVVTWLMGVPRSIPIRAQTQASGPQPSFEVASVKCP